MKNLLCVFAVCFTLGLFISSCATAGSAPMAEESSAKRKYVGEKQANKNLAEFLRKNTALSIEGTHPSIRISMRGTNTITGDARPYFIIDGVRLGRSYTQADNTVNLNNIKSVRVLKGLSELAVYGEDGVNGVILLDHYTN